jgi:hypothetical protein
LDDDHQAIGLSPRRTTSEDITALQGYHDPYLLVIMDEAAAFNRLTWDAIGGLATAENNRVLAIGNPIAQSGAFYEACQSPYWNYIHVSGLEVPNVVHKKEVVPGLTSYRWVKEQIAYHCQEAEENIPGGFEFEGIWYKPDNYFMTQVLGKAPLESEDQLISLEWIRICQMLEASRREGDHPVIGFDPSRGGNDAAMIARIGAKVLWVRRKKPISKNPSEEQAQWIKEEVRKLGVTHVYIDAVGIGAGVADACRREGLPVIDVNFSFAARQTKRFNNLRSECYWIIRDLLQQEKLAIPDDDMLEADLLAQKYSYDALGRIQLEDKRQIQKRLGRSPDTSDALAITFSMGSLADGILMSAADVQSLKSPTGSRWHQETNPSRGRHGMDRYTGSKWRKFTNVRH